MLEWLLEMFHTDTVSGRVRRLCRGSPDERRAAERELSQSQDARATPALMAFLAEKDPGIRERAARGLVLVGGAQAAKGLLGALWDSNDLVRQAAAAGLHCLSWRPADDAERALFAFAGGRESERQELERLGSAVAPGVVPLLNHEAKSVRGPAARFLIQVGDQSAVEPLAKILNDRDEEIRLDAALALGKAGDHRAVEPLMEALKNENAEIRVAAAEAIGNCGDKRAVESLRRALKDDYMEVRVAAAEALGKCEDQSAVEPLIQAFKDNPWDAHVQSAATRSLGLIGRSRALVMLRTALVDSSANNRRAAVEALGSLADSRAIELLIPMLKDDDEEVRGEASAALVRLGAADRVLTEVSATGSSIVINASRKLPESQRVEFLLKLLTEGLADDNLPEIFHALGAAGDERAVVPLLAQISHGNAAIVAAEALLKILGRSAPALSEEILRRIGNLGEVMEKSREEHTPAVEAQNAGSGSADLGALRQMARRELERRKLPIRPPAD